MAIQLRRGNYSNFDPQKMKPAEVAVVQSGDPVSSDGKGVYVAIQAGVVKRLASIDEMQDAIYNQTEEVIDQIEQGLADDIEQAEAAADRAEAAAQTLVIDDTLTQTGQPADAKATGDALAAIVPGLTDAAKSALLTCFKCVAWVDGRGQDYFNALERALLTRAVNGADLINAGMWYSAYPYYQSNNARLAYTRLDLDVVGGKIYNIKVRTSQQNVNMRVDIYNQNVLANAENESNISTADHIISTGDWNAIEQAVITPKRINNNKTAGIICILKHSDDSNISVGAVSSIEVTEKHINSLPSEYMEYDYIALAGTSSKTVDKTGVIKTSVYDNLARANISFDYLATNNLGTGNTPILGVRAANDWTHCVCVYITSGNSYTVYSHGNKTISSAVEKNKSTHVDLKQGVETPSVFVSNGTKNTIDWTQDNTVNAPLYLFANPIHNEASQFALQANVQLGQFVVWGANQEPDVYVPAVRNSDDVIGVYNLTRHVFCTCIESTKAKIGNTNCIYQVGNWT